MLQIYSRPLRWPLLCSADIQLSVVLVWWTTMTTRKMPWKTLSSRWLVWSRLCLRYLDLSARFGAIHSNGRPPLPLWCQQHERESVRGLFRLSSATKSDKINILLSSSCSHFRDHHHVNHQLHSASTLVQSCILIAIILPLLLCPRFELIP